MKDHLLYSELKEIIPAPGIKVIRISGKFRFSRLPSRFDKERWEYFRSILENLGRKERPIWHDFGRYSVLMKKIGYGILPHQNLNTELRNYELKEGYYKVRYYEVLEVRII